MLDRDRHTRIAFLEEPIRFAVTGLLILIVAAGLIFGGVKMMRKVSRGGGIFAMALGGGLILVVIVGAWATACYTSLESSSFGCRVWVGGEQWSDEDLAAVSTVGFELTPTGDVPYKLVERNAGMFQDGQAIVQFTFPILSADTVRQNLTLLGFVVEDEDCLRDPVVGDFLECKAKGAPVTLEFLPEESHVVVEMPRSLVLDTANRLNN